MGRRATVATTSVLAAPRTVLWRHATTFAGIGAELWPWLDMTTPHGVDGYRLDDVAPGTPLGRSVLLLGGIVPVEYDDITIAELDPGRRFLERSRTMTTIRWEHERLFEDAAAGCQVTDVVSVELRPVLRHLPGMERFVRAGVTALFAHRHRRLRRRFGGR